MEINSPERPKPKEKVTVLSYEYSEWKKALERCKNSHTASCLFTYLNNDTSLTGTETQRLENEVSIIKDLYGIDIIYSTEDIQNIVKEQKEHLHDDEGSGHEQWELYRITPATGEELKRLMHNTTILLSQYPKELSLKNLGLTDIIFASEILLKHKKTGKTKTAVGLFDNGKIYLTGQKSSTLHHEIFHLFDPSIKRDNELWQSKIDDSPESWSGSWPWNGEDIIEYTGEGWKDLPERPDGFVSKYATSEVNEDQAETFTYMMMNSPFYEGFGNSVVTPFTTQDRVIQGKVKLIKELTAKIGLDESFWNTKSK